MRLAAKAIHLRLTASFLVPLLRRLAPHIEAQCIAARRGPSSSELRSQRRGRVWMEPLRNLCDRVAVSHGYSLFRYEGTAPETSGG